jgi:lipid-A-disaccharide synthase
MSAKVDLPEPRAGRPDLLVVAGEHSGDQHASRMVRGLGKRTPQPAVVAVGGEALENAGAQLLFDLTRHSVVGLVEVIRNYSFFKALFEALLQWIEEHRPRHICLVDYPGFNLRLARELHRRGISRKGGGETAVFYYISPQIWAWKAGRRFEMAEWLDALGVIFPFEVDCYADTDLTTAFVGHPFLAEDHEPLLRYAPDGPVLLLPGSRRQPVRRIFPSMLEAFLHLREDRPKERAVVIYPEAGVRETLEGIFASRPGARESCELVPADGPVSGKAALTSSGTISLACGLAGVPGAIAYRAHPLTYLWGRSMIQVRYLGIVNLLFDETRYPEYIQHRAKPEALARELRSAIEDSSRVEEARECARRLREMLSAGEDAPDAAAWLAGLMAIS